MGLHFVISKCLLLVVILRWLKSDIPSYSICTLSSRNVSLNYFTITGELIITRLNTREILRRAQLTPARDFGAARPIGALNDWRLNDPADIYTQDVREIYDLHGLTSSYFPIKR